MQCKDGVGRNNPAETKKPKNLCRDPEALETAVCDTEDIIQALSAFALARRFVWNGLPKALAGFPTFSKVFCTSLI